MSEIWSSMLSAYWSATQVSANLAIFLTLAGALLLGLVVGYERTFHGRAVGMRAYGLVCMSSAALTTFVGYPSLWYGGHAVATATVDPTRVVQGMHVGQSPADAEYGSSEAATHDRPHLAPGPAVAGHPNSVTSLALNPRSRR